MHMYYVFEGIICPGPVLNQRGSFIYTPGLIFPSLVWWWIISHLQDLPPGPLSAPFAFSISRDCPSQLILGFPATIARVVMVVGALSGFASAGRAIF